MSTACIAICTYNGAATLGSLIATLRRQSASVPFEILVIDNNSTDETAAIAERAAGEPGAPVRLVAEREQGIPYARNRAIEASAGNDYLAFIDVDELPGERWLVSAITALRDEGAACVGGPIRVRLPVERRPDWLTDDLLGFLGALDHGPEPFWITDDRTPVWSGNVAYRRSLFDDGRRFDTRYNRRGRGIGGGSDGIMFRALLADGVRMRYRPDMLIEHFVEPWKLLRRYFLQLHYIAGRKAGAFQDLPADRTLFGVPPYLLAQTCRQAGKALGAMLARRPGYVRQAMNAAHAAGMVVGRLQRWRASEGDPT